MKLALFCAAALALACAGCAQQSTQQDAKDDYKAPVYRTGSNIPTGRETASDSSQPRSPQGPLQGLPPVITPNRGN